MTNLKILIIFILLLIATGCEKKTSIDINLSNYLPDGIMGAVYTYKFPYNTMKNTELRRTLTARDEKCVQFDERLISNNNIEAKRIRKICVDGNKFFSIPGNGAEPIVDLSRKEWIGYNEDIDGNPTNFLCHVAKKNGVIENKGQYIGSMKILHNTFLIQCQAKKTTVTFLFAEKLGLVQLESSVKGFGVVDGFYFKSLTNTPIPEFSTK